MKMQSCRCCRHPTPRRKLRSIRIKKTYNGSREELFSGVCTDCVRTIKLCMKMIGQKQTPEIYLEANKGGDYLRLRAYSDEEIYMEIGHCCVVFGRFHINPMILTSLLAAAVSTQNPDGIGAGLQYLGFLNDGSWDKELSEKLKASIKEVK